MSARFAIAPLVACLVVGCSGREPEPVAEAKIQEPAKETPLPPVPKGIRPDDSKGAILSERDKAFFRSWYAATVVAERDSRAVAAEADSGVLGFQKDHAARQAAYAKRVNERFGLSPAEARAIISAATGADVDANEPPEGTTIEMILHPEEGTELHKMLSGGVSP